MVLDQILIASFIVSLVSLIGVFTLSMNDKLLHSLLFLMVAFAGGALLGAAFFDLLPEGIEMAGVEPAMEIAVLGIISFFIIEKFLHWHHHHKHHHVGEKGEHPFTYLILIGDGVHNFIDGSVIAASFIASPATGIVTTLAIIAHEIPQEIADFSLLIYGGFDKGKALFFNFLSALTAMVGAVATFYLFPIVPGIVTFLVPFAAGHFIYVACADLVPELQKEKGAKRSAVQLIAFMLGLVLIGLLIKRLDG